MRPPEASLGQRRKPEEDGVCCAFPVGWSWRVGAEKPSSRCMESPGAHMFSTRTWAPFIGAGGQDPQQVQSSSPVVARESRLGGGGVAGELLAWAACLSWLAPRLPCEEEMYIQADFRNQKCPQDQVLSVLPSRPCGPGALDGHPEGRLIHLSFSPCQPRACQASLLYTLSPSEWTLESWLCHEPQASPLLLSLPDGDITRVRLAMAGGKL